MSSPLERMERRKSEAELWLDLLKKAEAATKARGNNKDHQYDLAELRMAIHALKDRRR